MRIAACHDVPLALEREWVVYWMTSARRADWNFALDRAVKLARQWTRPLVIVETLPCGGCWDTDRHHRFVLEGMAEHARRLADKAVWYYPFVERKPGQAGMLLSALARRACVVVVDEFPIDSPAGQAVGRLRGARVEKIDGNGLLPLHVTDRVFSTAYAFRRFLQQSLPNHLADLPQARPFARLELPRIEVLPEEIVSRWPPASPELLAASASALALLPIDHGPAPAPIRGGPSAARSLLKRFLETKLARYPDERNQPEADVTSGLAPYLHFGHVSIHEIFVRLAQHEGWSPDKLSTKATGGREGYWGMSPAAEAFLDQAITWRELGFQNCAHQAEFDRWQSLPDWARKTLSAHALDPRPHRYALPQFAAAATHDPLWNAAQRQLLLEGRIHNYLRMLWGKKILEWSRDPQEALETMVELNHRYALDGQDPNSYSGIFWILGRYDRPWAPKRPIFGTVRYMSSASALKKLRLTEYLRRFGPDSA